MAAPNIINPTTVTGKTSQTNLTTTSATSILSNASSSGKALKVNAIFIANVDTSTAYSITINYYSAAALGGTPLALLSTVSVPANSTLILDRNSYFYVEEDKSLGATASSANKFVITVSYEDIS